MHVGNTYQDGPWLIADYEMYVDKENLPFSIFDRTYYMNPNRTGYAMGAKFRRYLINTETGSVTFNDILSYDKDNAGFPIINPSYQGKKNCFSYITELQNYVHVNAILKIDHCHNNKITRW